MTNRTLQEKGFTLVELMVTVAVAAIILMVAIPSFKEMIDNNRLVTQVNAFTTSLAIARSEAIQRSLQVTVCKSANGTSCTTAGNWEQGWIVFEDTNGDGSNVGDDTIRVFSALPSGYTLREGGNFGDWIAYTRTGMSAGSAGVSDTFRVCTANAVTTESRAIEINTTGRARLIASAASCP
jgi:type IV fimbrial biogenesis protein FimT